MALRGIACKQSTLNTDAVSVLRVSLCSMAPVAHAAPVQFAFLCVQQTYAADKLGWLFLAVAWMDLCARGCKLDCQWLRVVAAAKSTAGSTGLPPREAVGHLDQHK